MRIGVAAVAAVFVCVVSGCGGGSGETAAIHVKGTEYSFQMPDKGKAGVVKLDVSNTGKELHEFAVGRLAPGKTLADVKAYLASGNEKTPDWFTDIGGVPLLSPGERLSITRELQPATYVLLCFIPSPKGVPHVNLGMLKVVRARRRLGGQATRPRRRHHGEQERL